MDKPLIGNHSFQWNSKVPRQTRTKTSRHFYLFGFVHCSTVAYCTSLIKIMLGFVFSFFLFYTWFQLASFTDNWIGGVFLVPVSFIFALDATVLLCYIVCCGQNVETADTMVTAWSSWLTFSIGFAIVNFWLIFRQLLYSGNEDAFKNGALYHLLNGTDSSARIYIGISLSLIPFLFCAISWYSAVLYKGYLQAPTSLDKTILVEEGVDALELPNFREIPKIRGGMV